MGREMVDDVIAVRDNRSCEAMSKQEGKRRERKRGGGIGGEEVSLEGKLKTKKAASSNSERNLVISGGKGETQRCLPCTSPIQ